MKADRRHELQHNVLADRLGEWLDRARNYSQAITATVVGVIILTGVYLYVTGQSAKRNRQAWARYIVATEQATLRRGSLDPLKNVADQYSSTTGGQWARLALADIQFDQGSQQLYENRSQAIVFLGTARDNYVLLRETASEPQLQERALLGLARCYEALNQLDQARTEYDTLLKRYPNSVFADEVRQRRADLDKPATKAFYDWLAKQDVKPTPPAVPDIPGHKPNFDLRTLPAEGPIFSPETPAK